MAASVAEEGLQGCWNSWVANCNVEERIQEHLGGKGIDDFCKILSDSKWRTEFLGGIL